MKKLLSVLILIFVGLFGWYLLSPLFVDEVVDEEFPFETEENAQIQDNESSAESLVDLSEEELEAMMEGMTEEEKANMEEDILEEYSQQPDTVMEEEMTGETEPIQISSGSFVGADDFHQGSGAASLYTLQDGSHLLRFEDFSVTNGPDLRIYLTQSSNPTKEEVKNGLELEKLKGNKGNQNYVLPEGVNPEDYGAVVIYCKPFSVIFSVANLN